MGGGLEIVVVDVYLTQ